MRTVGLETETERSAGQTPGGTLIHGVKGSQSSGFGYLMPPSGGVPGTSDRFKTPQWSRDSLDGSGIPGVLGPRCL